MHDARRASELRAFDRLVLSLMAHAKKTLEPGTWYAGFHSPFFVANSMIAAALAKLGFTDVRFFDRGAGSLPVDPKLDPNYDDKWSTWLEATYAGATKPVDVPAQVSWLLHSSAGTKAPAPSPATPAAKPLASTGARALVLLLVLYELSEAS